MDEYISRAEALRAVQKQRGANRSPAQNAMLDRICCDIKNRPAADVAPVVHAKWIPFHSEAAGDIQYCSACDIGFDARMDYCPHCGARMDGWIYNAIKGGESKISEWFEAPKTASQLTEELNRQEEAANVE